MPKCQLTKKRKCLKANTYSIRGISKKKKGIGLNITGKNRRPNGFKPNVHKKRFYLPEEKRWVTLTLSTAAIRTIDKRGIAHVVRKLRAEGQKI